MMLSRLMSNKWARMISEAEKLVGYTGSYFSLQNLLTDEMAQVALSVRKMMNTKHPLFQTAKHLVYDNGNAVQTWGLTVLLISRAANCCFNGVKSDFPKGEIYSNQRSLAEITELICTANLIHRGILNVEDMQNEEKQSLTLGNKLSVLGGDYLLASASMALAKLKNPIVINDIAQAIADMTEAEFFSQPKTVADWEREIFLASGSLLAHSCRSSLELVQHNEELKRAAFDFAKNIPHMLAIQRTLNENEINTNDKTSLFSAEFLLSGANMTKTNLVDLLKTYGTMALNNLSKFPMSETRKTLENITAALMGKEHRTF